jgi:hypothetical protein
MKHHINPIEQPEAFAVLTNLASTTNNMSRMVVDVMPEYVRKKLDEMWSQMSKDLIDHDRMKEKAGASLN